MRTALVGVVALLFGGCATGGVDDTTTRSDSAHPDDVDGPDDTTRSDASPESSVADSSIDSTKGDAATPDSSITETTAGDTLATDTATPADTSVADSAVTDTAVADTATPDTLVADTLVPDTLVADTAVPDTATPDTADATSTCPTPVTLGNFDTGADAWTFDPLWRWNSGSASMVAGSTTSYSGSYTQNLTKPTNVDVSACASVTLSFSVRLADDPDYTSKGPDKSERLYVQCSGDGGATWTNLTPSPWPTSQSACATSYCCGGPGTGRSFPLTAQSIVLPAVCRTAATRVRFQAKGSSVWNLQNPGWYVDSIRLN